MKRFLLVTIAMVSGMLAMAIDAPERLKWVKEDLTFYWEINEEAEYATYTLDGVTRGFLCYRGSSYSPNPLYLSPGEHTFCVCLADANLNYSDWACIQIEIVDSLDQEIPEGPAAPINLQAWQSGPNAITLSWQPGDESTRFSVFLDDRAINYNVQSNSFVIMGVEAGTHTVGVCAWDENGYVSEMISTTVVCQGAVTYTVPLSQAHWSFENDPEWIRGSVLLTNTEKAEYAFSDSSAMVLESEAGATAYVILPMISDVQDYDSLQLSFVARGGYWSRSAEVWGRTAHDHRLVVGAIGGLPYTGFRSDSVSVLLEAELPFANPFNMDDYEADSTHYWRRFSIPLTSSTAPFIVFYGESARANYVILDDIRISKIVPPEEPSDNEDPTDEPSGQEETRVNAPRKVLRNGTVVIIRNGKEYDLTGRRTRIL